jgi:hypothetical protein
MQAGLLLVTMLASAASRNYMMRITVLSAERQSVILDNSGVPKNCDGLNFDAYCHSSLAAQVTNTLLVREDGGDPFRVACAVDSRWSRCALLPEGASFDARKEKHGITIYYQDDNGKARSQLYSLVAKDAMTNPAATGYLPSAGGAGSVAPDAKVSPAATAAPAAGAGRVPPDTKVTAPAGAVAPPALTPAQSAAQSPAAVAVPGDSRQSVKCRFTSTPAGAEVTVDGRFAGSTPSVLALAAGTHVVVVSLRGFAEWKRDLSVSSGSELTVNAVLKKAP